MIKHYLLLAWRNLMKNKLVSGINILGLTFGLASSVLVILFATNELSYEKCHTKANRTCLIYLDGDFGSVKWVPNTFGPEGNDLKNMFPEIESYSLHRQISGIVKSDDNLFKEDSILFVDSSFFSILTIPFVKGQPKYDPQSICISEKIAAKYYGTENAIGKLLRLDCSGRKNLLTVTGVFSEPSSNTEIKADFIVPLCVADNYGWQYRSFYGTNFESLLLLRPGVDVDKLNKKIAKKYIIPAEIPNLKARLMPLEKVHMEGLFINNYGKLLAFIISGFFVLISSCFNYVNLTNILISSRSREIAVRKVNGASKTRVFVQFMYNNALATCIAFVLAVLVLIITLPWFNSIMETHLKVDLSRNFVLTALALFLLTTILSGLFPAIKFSALKPISLFQKAGISLKGKNSSLWVLTTIQFFLSVLFIQVMLIVNKQTNYMTNADKLGYDYNDVIGLPGYEWGELDKVKAELLKSPAIKVVSWGSMLPGLDMSMTSEWKEDKNNDQALSISMEDDYLKLFNIKLKQGRFFSKEFTNDNNSLVINKKTADALGYNDPIGKQMLAYGKQYTIIGVVDRYQVTPVIFADMPMLITKSRKKADDLIIKVDPLNRNAAHKHIKTVLHKMNPDYPVTIRYHLDKLLEGSKPYEAAGKMIQMFFYLTIFTSLIGLFALSVFIAEKNTKQICIRKINGASVASILPYLLKGIMLQVTIAILLATPLAFMFSQNYLKMFTIHFTPGVSIFLFGGLLAATITFLTVSWQSWRAATRNPVEALRSE